MQFSGQNITAERGSSEGDIPTTDEHGQPRKRDNIYPNEESTIDIIRRAMRLRRRPAHRGLLLPTIGRDTPLRAHCLRRDTHLQRLTHRHRLPLPLQRITNNEELIITIPWQAPMLGARSSCLSCLPDSLKLCTFD